MGVLVWIFFFTHLETENDEVKMVLLCQYG